MDDLHGSEPAYRVCAFGPGDLEQRAFVGPHAFTDASDWFEQLKAEPAARQLWLLRHDGLAWQMVAGEERRAGRGEWAAVHWADVPVPAGA